MTSGDPKLITLRSRNNKVVEITDDRDRAFIKQADGLIVKIDKLLESKRKSPVKSDPHCCPRGDASARFLQRSNT